MAQQPVPQYSRKPYKQLDGGLSTRADALQIPASQFCQLDNAMNADHDVLEKAPGYSLDGSPFPNVTDSFIRMLVNFRVGTSVNSIVCAAQDDNNTNATYKVDLKQTFGDGTYNYIGYTTGTSLFTNGSAAVVGIGTAYNLHLKAGDKIGTGAHPSIWYTVTSITDATHLTLSVNYAEATTASTTYMARVILNLNNIPVSLVFNNKCIITNGSEKMMEFDNTTMTLIQDANAPLATLLEKHKNRVFAANTPSAPSGLSWSKTNDETVWNAASIASVFPQDNGQLVAVKSFGDSLLCFKDNGIIYRTTGDFDQDVVGAPASIKKLDCPDNLGIIAGKSVVINDDNYLYFSCETGLYTIDPYWFQIKKVSWDISPTLQNLIFKSAATSSKSFVYSTQAQWNTGTHNGTNANTSNQLTTYNDRLSLLGNVQSIDGAACAIDSSNNVHAATTVAISSEWWISYSLYSSQNVALTENLYHIGNNLSSNLRAISVAPAANGNVGLAALVTGPGWAGPNILYFERTTIGNASFTSGSNAVSGFGTAWLTGTSPLTAGSLIKNSVDGSFATISTVNSDTSITLTAIYAGTSSVSSGYIAWAGPVTVLALSTATTYQASNGLDMRFSGNDPRIAYCADGVGANMSGANFYYRSGGTFTAVSLASLNTGVTVPGRRASLTISGANVSVSFTFDNTAIQCWVSSNGGGSFTLLENFPITLQSAQMIQVSRDGAGNSITGFGDGSIKKRNHSTTVTTTIDSSANSQSNGYVFYNGNDYAMNIVGISPAQVEKYTFLSSSTASDPTANRLISGTAVSRGFDNSGSVFASIAFGSNSGEVVIRRISFQGIWTSPKQSDSSLTTWGTYAVTGEADNSATVVHQVALGSTSTLGSPATITNGSIVSSDATKIFYQVTITMTIGSLSAPVIGSVVLNYQGAGASTTTQVGFVFNNELYLTVAENGNNNNNAVIFYDRKHAFYRWTPSVSTFARMNQTLYAGSSVSGNVYKMRTGYDQAGSAYTMTAVTKEDMLGSLELNKDIYKIYVLFRVQSSGTFTFSYRLDSLKTVGGSAWKDTVVDQTKGGIVEIPVNTSNVSSLQMKITQAGSGVNVQIVGAVVMFGYLNVR